MVIFQPTRCLQTITSNQMQNRRDRTLFIAGRRQKQGAYRWIEKAMNGDSWYLSMFDKALTSLMMERPDPGTGVELEIGRWAVYRNIKRRCKGGSGRRKKRGVALYRNWAKGEWRHLLPFLPFFHPLIPSRLPLLFSVVNRRKTKNKNTYHHREEKGQK